MGGTPSEGLQRLRAALLGSFAGTGVVEPVEATFRHVINQLSGTGLVASLDEETVTGALLGGFATAFPVCLGAFTESAEEAERMVGVNHPPPRLLIEKETCDWFESRTEPSVVLFSHLPVRAGVTFGAPRQHSRQSLMPDCARGKTAVRDNHGRMPIPFGRAI